MVAVIDWRPIRGCSPISAGCANCAAMKAAPASLTKPSRAGPVWSGKLAFDRDALRLPDDLMPVLVCANGDAFHESAPDEWLDAVFDEIERGITHAAFSLVTKRSARMRSYLTTRYAERAPPRNLHLGVTAERQLEADERLTDLAATPAALKFVQFYPLLGPIEPDLSGVAYALAGEEPQRPALEVWFTALAASCAASGVPLTRWNEIVPH